MAKFTTGEKIGILSNAVTFALCKSPSPHYPLPHCGKLLWKNLWRMWKSMSFQQVFLILFQAPPPVDNFPFFPHKDSPLQPISMLRYRRFGAVFPQNPVKKLGSLRKMLSKNCRHTVSPIIFCEIRQKIRWYHLPPAGDTFPDNASMGGTPCREK